MGGAASDPLGHQVGLHMVAECIMVHNQAECETAAYGGW